MPSTAMINSSIFFLTFLIFCIYHSTSAEVGCTPDVCNHHGTCVPNISNGFTCQCDPGFTGTTCNEELDECLSSPCANNGTCTDLENGFLCHCLPEWNGTLCTEAKDPCRSSPCGPFGKCITTNQPQIPYYCQCPDGQNTVFRCAEPNPCLPNPCGAGECEVTTNHLTNYICRCYDGTVQMTNCSSPQNPCLTMPCGPHGRCLALTAAPKGYMCMCQSDGLSYTTIDTCPTSNMFCTHMTCKNGGTCIPFNLQEPACKLGQSGSTCCLCPPNFTGSRCEQELDACSSNPCKSNGRCTSTGDGGYRCQCYEGFTGEHCQTRVTQSGCASNPCSVGICYQLNQHGSAYVCICPDGTLNLSCNTTANKTQSTSAMPKIDGLVKYRSGGEEKLPINSVLSTCNPNARSPCNGGRCVPISDGVYGCQCRAGYTGVYCETNINECASNPCANGATCYDLVNAYVCFCPDRVFRPQCNTTGPISSGVHNHTSVLIASSPSKVAHPTVERPFCPCRNGGLCSTNSQSRSLCQCLNGFTGAYCETAIATRLNTGRMTCNQLLCQNGGTCQEQGLNVICNCKPGYAGSRCENEYFRCQGNGRFTDAMNCKQGRYFECVYYGQYDLNLPNGILFSRSCPTGLWFSALNDRCDYPSAVQC